MDLVVHRRSLDPRGSGGLRDRLHRQGGCRAGEQQIVRDDRRRGDRRADRTGSHGDGRHRSVSVRHGDVRESFHARRRFAPGLRRIGGGRDPRVEPGRTRTAAGGEGAVQLESSPTDQRAASVRRCRCARRFTRVHIRPSSAQDAARQDPEGSVARRGADLGRRLGSRSPAHTS